MVALTWDGTGERLYETGVDRGVLYPMTSSGTYGTGVAWNGLTAVNETPSGGEMNAQYADNIKYANIMSAEEFGGTIEAFTYPDEFAECDGTASPTEGLTIGQQPRKAFGLSYRTKIGNDVDGVDHGYKLHLVYGATVSPSEKAYSTINDSPEAMTFSWEFTTNAVSAGSTYKPTSILTIDSTKVDSAKLATLEATLYGAEAAEPTLPLPEAVITMLSV